MTASRIQVLLPLPLDGVLDYAPGGHDLAPGDFVRVPLGNRTVVGVVWADASDSSLPDARLKAVSERLDLPPLTDASRRFVDWVANYSLSLPCVVLRMLLCVPAVFEDAPLRRLYLASGPPPERMTEPRARVLAVLKDQVPRAVRDLVRLSGAGEGVVRGLIDAGALLPVSVSVDRPYSPPDAALDSPALSAEQAAAANGIVEALADGFQPIVLEGVTGSGKTEVYFETIARALASDKSQVLVLLPEIALTSQWLQRFQDRFGVEPVMWHSDIGMAERRRAWKAIASGNARVVVGARSALFLPYADLRLIIVDEEHDQAFKQEDGVIYQARDMAVVRAHIGEIPIVLASATPSLETLYNVERGRYRRFHLPNRHGVAELPQIAAIDLRSSPPPRGAFLSPPLRAALTRTFDAGEQALLFLNRRGYAPLTLCRACGHRIECPHCTAWLVEHRLTGRLMCHHCGHNEPLPHACAACGAEDSLVPCGPGVERIAEEMQSLFPDRRLMVMSSDGISSPSRLAAMIADITDHRVDCIIGTQMVTKGYHFPKLTLVGVVDADLGLAGGDLRAAERTYQQLSQVAGRAGREALRGQVLLQTHMPDHAVVAALIKGDPRDFIVAEMAAREAQGMPPFGRLAAVILSSEDAQAVERLARRLARTAPHDRDVTVLGPAPAPFALLRGRHRWRLLLKARRQVDVQNALRNWLRRARGEKGVRIHVDVDPYSFL